MRREQTTESNTISCLGRAKFFVGMVASSHAVFAMIDVPIGFGNSFP